MVYDPNTGLRDNTSLIPLAADQARQKALAALLNNNQNAQGNQYEADVIPKYDWATRAGNISQATANLNFESSKNSADNAVKLLNSIKYVNPPVAGGAAAGGNNVSPRLGAVMRALRMQESGGNFGAVNPDSGALGGWQVMPANIQGSGRGWDYEALGRDVSTQDFLRSRALQQQIVRYKLGKYLQDYGVRGALSAWYSGSPTRWNEKTPQGGYPSVHEYVLQVLRRLGM